MGGVSLAGQSFRGGRERLARETRVELVNGILMDDDEIWAVM